jgi:hypothetical protein
MHTVWIVAVTVTAVNLPFGFWRAGLRRFTVAWFVAVHAPVPIVVVLRIFSGLGFQISTVPILVTAYFMGQFVGGRIRRSTPPRRADRRSGGQADSPPPLPPN